MEIYIALVATQMPALLITFTEVFQERCAHGRGELEWRESELQDYLKTYVAEVVKGCEVCIYVDALDECGEESALRLIDFFESVVSPPQAEKPFSLRICFSCRHYPILVLDKRFETVVEDANAQDIQTYVQNKVRDPLRHNEVVRDIQRDTVHRSSSAFQWVVLIVS